MSKHFKNIKSLEDLKNQFRTLAKNNHPNTGGSTETMQEINCEYDALFPIWRTNTTIETADSTRSEFYTEMGWKGKNHNWNRSLKEIAQIVRAYVKEKYPTYKFSIRTEYASMCQELHVEMKESPTEIFKTYEELTHEEKYQGNSSIHAKLVVNNYFDDSNGWQEEEFKTATLKAWEISDFYKIHNDTTSAVLKDVDKFVSSYNYEDCDSQIDYFHVDFYYFGCGSRNVKIVPKTARLKGNKATTVLKTA